jgi:hypothetical protein
MRRFSRRFHAPRLIELAISIVVAGMTLGPGRAQAITLGQIDDFQLADTASWGGASPSHQPDVGPDGIGDHSLQANAFGTGASSGKLLLQNSDQWAGDWTGEEVAQISFDIRNPGDNSLTIRLGVAGPNGFGSGGLGDTYVTAGQSLPADDAWHHLTFDVTADAWEYVGLFGGTSIQETLADVMTLRLIHNPLASFRGEDIEASFLVDNITAEAAVAENNGDYNNDGVVDVADYVMWRKTLNQTADPAGSGADGDGDGTVELDDDYEHWFERFATIPPNGGGNSAVPEPASGALLVLMSLLSAPVGRTSRPLRHGAGGCR